MRGLARHSLAISDRTPDQVRKLCLSAEEWVGNGPVEVSDLMRVMGLLTDSGLARTMTRGGAGADNYISTLQPDIISYLVNVAGWQMDLYLLTD